MQINKINFLKKEEALKLPLFFILTFFCFLFSFAQETNQLTEQLIQLRRVDKSAEYLKLPEQDKLYWKNKQDLLFWNLNQIDKSENLKENLENRIDLLKDISFKKEIKDYYLAEHYLFSAIIEYEKGNNLTAAKQGLKAYNRLKSAIEENPDFIDPQIAFHYINIAVSFAPSSTHWILKLLGFQSNKTASLKTLNKLYPKLNKQLIAEYQLLYLFAGKNFGLDKISLNNNNLINLLVSRDLIKQKKIKQAKQKIDLIENHIYLKYFLLGKIHFIENNWDKAETYFKKYLTFPKTLSYQNIANFYLYQIGIVKNDNSLKEYKKHTLKKSKHPNYRDKWAIKECVKNNSIEFIKIRNAFDRGNNQEVLKITKELANINDFRIYYYQMKSEIILGNTNEGEIVWENWQQKFTKYESKEYYRPKALIELVKKLMETKSPKTGKYLSKLKSFNGNTYQDIESEINYLEWQYKNLK